MGESAFEAAWQVWVAAPVRRDLGRSALKEACEAYAAVELAGLRLEHARALDVAQAAHAQVVVELADAHKETERLRDLCTEWAEAAHDIVLNDHTPAALRRRGATLIEQASAHAGLLGQHAELKAKHEALREACTLTEAERGSYLATAEPNPSEKPRRIQELRGPLARIQAALAEHAQLAESEGAKRAAKSEFAQAPTAHDPLDPNTDMFAQMAMLADKAAKKREPRIATPNPAPSAAVVTPGPLDALVRRLDAHEGALRGLWKLVDAAKQGPEAFLDECAQLNYRMFDVEDASAKGGGSNG